ncbi:MAG: helix-turn-helix transcriptional regulator [Bacteroidales bacterium]|nr:helix-turn-helix transcriptional regulator [Bacteroidales bacterium]
MGSKNIFPEHSSLLKEIGNNLKDRRKANHMTINDTAKKMGLFRLTYMKLENGGNYNITTLFKALDYYKVSLSEFFCDFSTDVNN